MIRAVQHAGAALDEKTRYLAAVSPERILARGYSVTRDSAGNLIRNAADVSVGETVYTLRRVAWPAPSQAPRAMKTDEGAMTEDELKAMMYEQKEARLDAILERLDRSETPMDELASDAKEANHLIQSMRATLNATEAEIKRVFGEGEARSGGFRPVL